MRQTRAERIQRLKNNYFSPKKHPYHILEAEVERQLKPGSIVLEVGCGRSAPMLLALKKHPVRLIGVDMVPFTVNDANLDLFQCSITAMSPIKNASISVAFSRSVMEHI